MKYLYFTHSFIFSLLIVEMFSTLTEYKHMVSNRLQHFLILEREQYFTAIFNLIIYAYDFEFLIVLYGFHEILFGAEFIQCQLCGNMGL